MIISEEQIHNIVAESIARILSEKKVIKIPKKNATPAPQPAMDAMPPADPTMGGADPMAGASDPSMPDLGSEGEAPMGGDMGEAPMDTEDSGMVSSEGGSPKAEYIKKMIDSLPEEDLKAAEGYIESLTKDNGNEGEESPEMNTDAPMDNSAPMGESVVFTKGQLRKLNEVFGNEELNASKEDDNRVEKRKSPNTHRKSPFCSPM